MAYRILTLGFDPELDIFDEKPLNDFCLNKRILWQKSEFFQQNGRAYWSILLEYELVNEPKHISEDDGLDEKQRFLYQRLREWRREQSEKQGVPVYVIANNRMLKGLIQQKPQSLEALKDIRGWGGKKIEQYGEALLEILKLFQDQG